MTTFTVAQDGQDWIVLSTETRARSFAMVPTGFQWFFATKAEAIAQARKINDAFNMPIGTRMIETPDRFEAVADTQFGAAWE